MNILIVAPRFNTTIEQYYEFPLGLAYISAVLKKAGFKVFTINLNHEIDDDKTVLYKCITEKSIDIFCTGGISFHYNHVKKLVNLAKQFRPKILTIVGGGVLTSEPKLVYTDMKIDFGVVGEGELVIVNLIHAIINKQDFSKVNGIVYQKDENTLVTESQSSIKPLDSLPYPDYDGFDIEYYLDRQLPSDTSYSYPLDNPRRFPVVSTRSCPFSCTFCFHPVGKVYREHSLDYFFEYLDFIISKYKINILNIVDELFSCNKKRMIEFAQRIKKYNILWSVQLRVSDVTEEVLTILKDAGVYLISYGIESADESILKSMKKKTKLKDIENALYLTRKHNIGIQGNLIFGDTAETLETFNNSIEWWKRNSQYHIYLGMIEPYPGTPIYQEAIVSNKIKDKLKFIQQGSQLINLTKMSDEDFEMMKSTVAKYNIKYNKKFAKVLESSVIGKKDSKNLYGFSVRCPHCNGIVSYRNMRKDNNGSFLLGCRNCHQRFFLNPSEVYPQDTKSNQPGLDKISRLIQTQEPVAIIPCMPENNFIAKLEILGVDYQKLNMQYFLDASKDKIHSKYLTGQILDYKAEGFFKEIEEGVHFIIPPTFKEEVSNIIEDYLLLNGVKSDNIARLYYH